MNVSLKKSFLSFLSIWFFVFFIIPVAAATNPVSNSTSHDTSTNESYEYQSVENPPKEKLRHRVGNAIKRAGTKVKNTTLHAGRAIKRGAIQAKEGTVKAGQAVKKGVMTTGRAFKNAGRAFKETFKRDSSETDSYTPENTEQPYSPQLDRVGNEVATVRK